MSTRKPKGTYVRSTPDWFVGSLAIAGINTGTLLTNYSAAALYNNDSLSRYFYVYRMLVTAFTSGYLYAQVFNRNIGVNPIPAQPLDPTKANPPGVATAIFAALDPALTTAPFQIEFDGVLNTMAASVLQIADNFPIFIVPPGWELEVWAGAAQITMNAVWWYTYTADQG